MLCPINRIPFAAVVRRLAEKSRKDMTDPHAGWFKVGEEALRHLKRTFAEPSSYRKATAAYITLLRIANLRNSSVFPERIGAIADDMGYNYNDAAKALQLVKLAGLCEIETRTIPGSKERDQSVYRVKSMLPENGATLLEKDGRLHESRDDSPFSESTQEVPKNGQELKRTRSAGALLLQNEKFIKAWSTHLESLNQYQDKEELIEEHLRLCVHWSKKYGIEPTIAALEQSDVDHDSRYVMEPSARFPAQGEGSLRA